MPITPVDTLDPGSQLRPPARSAKPNVVVVGARGYIGTNLVPELAARNYRVRAVARSREVLAARRWPEVELAQADVLDAQSLTAALAGQNIAYYLGHCMRAGEGFDDIERQGAHNFATAAARAGVKRIVYLGGLIPRGAESIIMPIQAFIEFIIRIFLIPFGGLM